MKKPLILASAASLLALFVTGCESDGGIAARTQEKSAVYAILKPWEKNYIAKGTISQGFTPDMVYMAMGNPSKTEITTLPDGAGEVWTYSQYYPSVDAAHGFRFSGYSTESAYQPQMPAYQSNGKPMGMSATPDSIARTGGPQGGSMEPSALQSYTVAVLFREGKVVRFVAKMNVN